MWERPGVINIINRRNKQGLNFFIVVGVMLNSIGHIIIALYVGGYFSGLYSALAYLIVGPMLIKRIFDETRLV